MRTELTIEPVGSANLELAIEFLTDWVTGDEVSARHHVADHATGGGASLLALLDGEPVGIATVRWQSDYAGFRDRDIPLIHQVAVHEDVRREGIASTLMDRIEDLVRQRGHPTVGTTVGLADTYGPAQRLYARRGYLPDGRGACLGHDPVPLDAVVVLDHDLVLWLTKDVAAG